jgi:hypothetical protein
MNNIKIIDNFLDKENFNFLNNQFLNNEFPWYFQNGIVSKNDGSFQYTHLFFDNNKINSNFFNLIEPFLSLLKVKSLVKAKLNLTTREKVFKKFNLHTDVPFDCNTAVFYLNTNNGKTIFENAEEVKSVENRIIVFSSQLKHTGTTHTDTPYRIVLNLNYF